MVFSIRAGNIIAVLDRGRLGIAKFEDENNALEKRSGQRRVLKLRHRAY